MSQDILGPKTTPIMIKSLTITNTVPLLVKTNFKNLCMYTNFLKSQYLKTNEKMLGQFYVQSC